MEALTMSVVAGLIVNGLTTVLTQVGQKAREARHRERVRDILKDDAALERILQDAGEVADRDKGRDRLESFLRSPEAEGIVRQIYASLLTAKSKMYLEPLRRELTLSVSLHVHEPEQRVEELARRLFDELMKACERAVEACVEHGLISEEEVRAARRYGLIADELEGIQKNVALLTAAQKPDVTAILEFEERFRRQVGDRCKDIVPPHFDVARRVPVDDLYVEPDFVASAAKNGEPPRLEASDFLSAIYRAVVLGHPGCGKTTFAHKLCHDLAAGYSERLFGGRQVTPIPVVLREYGASKKEHDQSILEFIETTANSRYQVKPPPGAIEYLLLSGRALVIFDGLDELLDTSFRQEVSRDVESFCNLYPSVPVLVTSREVGYEQAPLAVKRFETFRLAPFDDGQVTEYAKKWFALEVDLAADERGRKAKAFLEESQTVSDLRANPLMLALMCNIYRGENYIPRNRPDVYEKCAVMLFERWDKSRGILVPLPFEAHISPAIKYLAHWIYTGDALQAGVTETDLVAKATQYLCSWRFEDPDEAQKAAQEFIDFCRGRAWVFSDTGTTREGERLYQFTHRTFLEYFTAAHLVRIRPTPEALRAVLLPKIAKREWDVVAQLAFQLQNKNVEGAGDELLKAVVDEALRNGELKEWNFLSFAARCLEFIVPRPGLTRRVTTTCLDRSVAWSLKKKPSKKRSRSFDRGGPETAIGPLLSAAVENREVISGTFEKVLVERINHGEEDESVVATEIGLEPGVYLHIAGPTGRGLQPGLVEFWRSVSDRVFEACSERIRALYPRDLRLCVEGLWRGAVGVEDVVRLHGVEGLFVSCELKTLSGVRLLSTAEEIIGGLELLSRSEGAELPERFGLVRRRLEQTGRALISHPPPWVGEDAVRQARHLPDVPLPEAPGGGARFRQQLKEQSLASPSDAAFGLFGLLSMVFETHLERRITVEDIAKSRWPFQGVFRARVGDEDGREIEAETERWGLAGEQRDFVQRWARREIHVVRRRRLRGIARTLPRPGSGR